MVFHFTDQHVTHGYLSADETLYITARVKSAQFCIACRGKQWRIYSASNDWSHGDVEKAIGPLTLDASAIKRGLELHHQVLEKNLQEQNQKRKTEEELRRQSIRKLTGAS